MYFCQCFIIFQLSTLQDWCETPLKAENANILKTLKDEKSIESKQFLEAIAVMNALSQAKCKLPTFMQFDLNLSTVKSRDKNFDLMASAIEAFAQNFQKNADGKGLVAVFTADEQPLKRRRRAVDDVNINFFPEFFVHFFR